MGHKKVNIEEVIKENKIKKEDILFLYKEKEYSIREISEYYSIIPNRVYKILDFFNIEKRNIKEACKTNRRKKQSEKTCEKKYGRGIINVSQAEDVKSKKAETFIKNWGVDNIFKVEWFPEYIDLVMLDKYGSKRITDGEKQKETKRNFSEEKKKKIAKKQKETKEKNWEEESKEYKDFFHEYRSFLSKEIFNRDEIKEVISRKQKELWNSLSEEEKYERVKHLFTIKKSSLEVRIENILKENNVDFNPQHNIGNYFYDFIIFGKALLEVNGDYWHANPKKYLAEDSLVFPNSRKIKAKYIWEKDMAKKSFAEEKGYKIIYIWEKDMKKMSDSEIMNFINSEVLNENKEN